MGMGVVVSSMTGRTVAAITGVHRGIAVAVHQLVQPWRGILDAGVVVGLSWGLASFVYSLQQAFVTGEYARSPELSDDDSQAGIYPDKITDGA